MKFRLRSMREVRRFLDELTHADGTIKTRIQFHTVRQDFTRKVLDDYIRAAETL